MGHPVFCNISRSEMGFYLLAFTYIDVHKMARLKLKFSGRKAPLEKCKLINQLS